MDFSVIAVGDIQNVLSAMQKNLECPICLDVIKEPVSTKCDHIFCRFCMFKLLSKKKKGVIQCPLCKTEVTKRSLKENSRFKQLIEGLLETIHAFELDTGVKFLHSHHFPKTSTEATAAEFLCTESSVIQSKGFRNREKSAKENGQENCTLEGNVNIQLTDTRVKRCPIKNKTQKCDSEKGIYIEFGSDSSEELFKQESNTGLEDKEALQILSPEKPEELKCAEKGNEYSCNTQPDKLDAEEVILPNVVGESDILKKGLSKKSTWSITEYAKPDQMDVTECQSSPLNVLAVDLPTEQSDRIGNASPVRNGDTSFFKSTEEMDAEQTQCNSKSKVFDFKDSSESKLDKTKEINTVVQSVEAVEMYEPENDSFHEELPREKLLQPETLHCATMNQVSRKKLKRSIQKVNEWFSKSNEILSSSSSQDDSAGATDVSGEGGTCLSDKDSCISEKTDPMVDSMEITVIEGNKRWSKQTADSIKDKIFGKTYKRERKSNPPIILRDILPTTKREDADKKCLNNSSKDGLKRKRKTARVLQPEDFIKKKDREEADGCPQNHSKYLKPENLQEEKTTAESLSRVCEKEELMTCESACVSPVTLFVGNTECTHTGEHQEDVSQVANQGNLTPIRMGTARTEGKNRWQKGKQGNEKTVSADIGIESELRQNPVKSNTRQSHQSDTEEHIFKRTELNRVNEICFSSESNQAGKAKVVDGKGPVLHFQSRSMICPAASQQRPAEFSCEVTGKKSTKRKRKRVKGKEEQATQTAGTGTPECLVTEALEEPVKGNSDLTGLSETPDGLLCSDDDIEENGFSETDRRERSAVFVKRSDNALVKEQHNSNVSSKPRSQGIQRSRRRAQKLQSSDEESSEDEDLPCFQTLIFGKSVSSPLQINKQVTSVVESSVHPITLPHSGSRHDNSMQKMPEATPSNGCVSPSQESECSVNLFSSQSNMSEESVDGAQELNKSLIQVHRSKQMSNVIETEETFQSSNRGLKRCRTNFRDESQEDPNTGANLGEASGYDSETSIVEDSCGPFSQGEILTTQQKNAMQNNLKKLQQEMAVLEAMLKQHGSRDPEFVPIHRKLPHSSSEGTLGMEQISQERENTDEQKSGTELNSASVLPNLSGNVTRSPNNSSSSVRLLNPQTAEATNSSVVALNASKSSTQERTSKRSGCFPVSVPHNAAGKENATGPAVTNRKEMSIVASGLNQSEHLVVQKFARKTQSTLSHHITEGTTHVIMKTDEELVCERTLKYFLGIAGRKWVVSYQWVIQSFKEGRILDEENFEVRGDVINGRNHQGPKRARQSLTEKTVYLISSEHLEWMVELCGASVVKQLHLFTHRTNSTAVVVVQPDAWMENTDYRAIQQKNNVAMVTREWVLDSVACYECQEFSAYLVS
ncbi:BRCA1 protein, partial [Nyctiprogne leucopyga]|nr:BRCA1 protein [Nyctiprogne leucopyga]